MDRPDLIGREISVQIAAALPNSLSGNPHRGESLRLSQATAIPAISAASPHGKAVTLQFGDNTLLPLLLGDHDRHMVRIEQALGVRLSCRGNRVAITGEASRVDAAQAMLEGLWRRLERGESVGRPEVEAAIRLAEADSRPAPAAVRYAGDPHAPRRGRAAQPGPGGLYRGAGDA